MGPSTRWSADSLIQQLAGDEQLAREMVALFIGECPRMLGLIHDALAGGDADAVRRAAHSFKGAVANFTNQGLTVTARQLEEAAAEGHLEEASALVQRLEGELGDLLREMTEFA